MNGTRMKAAVRFELSDYKKGSAVMYLVVYALFALTLISKGLHLGYNMGVDSGAELISAITLFIFGLNSFRDNFRFFSANGFSRKSLFLSTVASFGILCGIFALIDTVNGVFLAAVTDYRSFFMMLYAPLIPGPASGVGMGAAPLLLLENFLLLTVSYFCATMLGLLITTLYYRMNKGLKIAVSVGVPIALIYGTQLLNDYAFRGNLYPFLVNAFSAVWGIYRGGCWPFAAIGSQLLFGALFAAFAYLLARRAAVKK